MCTGIEEVGGAVTNSTCKSVCSTYKAIYGKECDGYAWGGSDGGNFLFCIIYAGGPGPVSSTTQPGADNGRPPHLDGYTSPVVGRSHSSMNCWSRCHSVPLYKFVFTANGGNNEIQLGEVELYGEGYVALTIVGATAPDSESPANQQPDGIFDGCSAELDPPCKWVALNFNTKGFATLVIALDTFDTVVAYDLMTGDDVPGRDPTEWTFWRHDGDDWVLVETVTDAHPPTNRNDWYDRKSLALYSPPSPPPSPPPPSPPPSTPRLCDNSCDFANNGRCEDGGLNSQAGGPTFSDQCDGTPYAPFCCAFGSDCDDCGVRNAPPNPPPPSPTVPPSSPPSGPTAVLCDNTCKTPAIYQSRDALGNYRELPAANNGRCALLPCFQIVPSRID